jgi:hypothetical protein
MFLQKKSFSRIRGGMRAKREGDAFQNFFFSSCHYAGIYAVRFPDGAKRTMRGGRPHLIQVQTPFDFILIGHGNSAYVDTKSISDDVVTYSFLTQHQVGVLFDIENRGLKAGYVVHFKLTNQVYFFKASLLRALKPRQSLKPEDGEHLGHLYKLNLKGFV